MEDKKHDIELRSEEFQEVLGSVPPWILRWGITVVAIVMGMLIAGSAIFRYPDVISSTVELTGVKPAVTVVARYSGKIQKLFVKDNQNVDKDMYLAIIENDAFVEDVIYLRDFLENNMPWTSDSVVLPKRDLILGGFQTVYSSYYTTLSEYKRFIVFDYYRNKADMMRRRIERNIDYAENMRKQERLTKIQLDISHKQYKRDSLLHYKGLISDLELENTYGLYIQNRISHENIMSNLDNQNIQIAQLYESLYDTEYQYLDKKDELELQLKSLFMQLQTDIRNWELAYVLKSPIDGKVTFTNYWVENQNVASGEEAFSIVPYNNGELVGKAFLPIERSGKVKTGQQVNIHFSNFPDSEFGMVNGKVKNISLVPVKINETSHYVVEISFPDGLLTTYGKTLPFVPGMEGQADIITADLSLLERFVFPIKKILTEHVLVHDPK